MSGEDLFLSNLDEIERAARFVARRARLSPEDADDLLSTLQIRLIENDYAVLRKFEGRCSLATYVASIAHRLFVDERMHVHGRWRPSAEAKRLGEAAVLLEGLLHREHTSFEEALPAVQRLYPISKEEAAAIAARLPPRGPRPRLVALEDQAEPAVTADTVEKEAIDHERAKKAAMVNRVVEETLAAFPLDDRVAFRLRFHDPPMSVANIARAQFRDQKKLYRRLETIERRLRQALVDAGINAAEARELTGGTDSHLDFGLSDPEIETSRQAMNSRGSGNHGVPE
jgi:RNA polymerase sigma factor (sigma-70 family)